MDIVNAWIITAKETNLSSDISSDSQSCQAASGMAELMASRGLFTASISRGTGLSVASNSIPLLSQIVGSNKDAEFRISGAVIREQVREGRVVHDPRLIDTTNTELPTAGQ